MQTRDKRVEGRGRKHLARQNSRTACVSPALTFDIQCWMFDFGFWMLDVWMLDVSPFSPSTPVPPSFSLPAMSILAELEWRGLFADCTDKAELAKRSASPLTLYCGFDPTADSLHVGNLVPLLALRRFQLLGHHPIAVAGGATGSIGDPSGKTQERQLLTREVLNHNIAQVKEQLRRLLDFETNTNPARLVDNATWTAPVSFLEFLRDIGKHFSVNQMVAKESVRARMEDREAGISYTEFSYMLLQAFDFYVLQRD